MMTARLMSQRMSCCVTLLGAGRRLEICVIGGGHANLTTVTHDEPKPGRHDRYLI